MAKTLSQIMDEYRAGKYISNMEIPDKVSENHVFDEDLSVRENRRMAAEHNKRVAEMKREKMNKNAELSRQLTRDVIDYIMDNYELNEAQAAIVENYVYTEKHSFMCDYFSALDDIAEIEMTSRGQKLGYKRGDLGMGSIEDNALKPFQAFPKSLNRNELDYKWKNILKESQSSYWTKREIIHKNEYVKAMLQSYDYKDVKDIVDAIDKMDYKQFRKTFEAEGGTFDFVYQPPDLNDNYDHYLSALRSQWLPNNKKKV